LLENHRAFLRYLERRVGDRARAEDILQNAFAKVVSRPDQAPRDEAIVPWFPNAPQRRRRSVRRRAAADRAYEAFARELESHETPTSDLKEEICAYVSRFAETLKPEYGEALQSIEVAGTPVKTFAEQKGCRRATQQYERFVPREALKKRVSVRRARSTGASTARADTHDR